MASSSFTTTTTGSSSPSMTSSSSPNNITRFDVFLSFRGEDTRHSFTDHLYAALRRAGISTFRDSDDISRGHVLVPEITKAIIASKASIVVLSTNYATSRWCLEELGLILEQRRKFNHFVLPVFYHVDPSDVRNQKYSFAIEVYDEGLKWTESNVNRWKAALTEVSNLSGITITGSETDGITKIVDTIDSELDVKLVSTPAHLTGMESRTKYINSWLKNEKSDVQILAICGMGGIGKTTLAKSIYNSHKKNFESSSFLEEVGKHNEQSYGLLSLQKQLVTDILGEKTDRIPGVSEGTVKIEKALQLKKVLIVLDDIDDKDEISTLLGTEGLHTQSKIIITT
ncbi:TMV resistance protein N-like protein, partial [Tanacetum coccineum]